MGKAMKNKPMQEKAVTDITKVAALYPDLGGKEQREKYNALLKEIQKAVGQPAVGLPAAENDNALTVQPNATFHYLTLISHPDHPRP